jgi:hypothetical protein
VRNKVEDEINRSCPQIWVSCGCHSGPTTVPNVSLASGATQVKLELSMNVRDEFIMSHHDSFDIQVNQLQLCYVE